ncbi:MAG: energy-coupling factor transport system substrate-specific component [Solirubrobacterales bacterium]|jgi:energy-coupling factor transport system substrate-specific component|nr:energy-coupling factor transport system substrate-specific component [Solirubrobacterales bacterium]
MDFRLATTLGILLVIGVGVAWFERSRPSSRVVALVASLTALAVASRLVLAPIPNVVGTTDVALLTGYALGGPPGFMVGALAAPISNIWLGQGPWTIWQMAGWGLAGLAGGGLAVAAGRDLGRLWLALACGAMGLLYGALLDLSVMVTYGGEQSLDRYLALSARGVPFNLAHAAGNFAIAFAAGPALVRMIARFRDRLEFTWHPAGALPVALAALVVSLGFAGAPEARADVSSGRAWLERTQNSDGGFAATPGQPSSAAMTTWAVLGLEAAGINPLDVESGGDSPIDFLRNVRITSATDLERTILALEGAGINSRSFEGRDLVAQLRSKRSGDGSWEGQVNITAFGILALRAASQGDVAKSADWLRDAQNANGGWGFAPGRGSEADSTGAALQALAAAGGSSSAVSDGARYLTQIQKGDGGWTLAGGVVNSQSTTWAVQGLVAAHGSGSATSKGVSYLAKRQAGDGHYSYSGASDQTPVWVTAQALTAVSRRPFPLGAVARAPRSRAGSPEGSDGPGRTGEGPGGEGGARNGGEGSGSKGDGNKGGQDEGGGGASEAETARGENVSPSETNSPQEVAEEGEEPDAEDGSGLSDGAKAGIGGGVLAVLVAGGVVYYRRSLA